MQLKTVAFQMTTFATEMTHTCFSPLLRRRLTGRLTLCESKFHRNGVWIAIFAWMKCALLSAILWHVRTILSWLESSTIKWHVGFVCGRVVMSNLTTLCSHHSFRNVEGLCKKDIFSDVRFEPIYILVESDGIRYI